MSEDDIFKPSGLPIHSWNRPPDVAVAEFKARRVWPDWDDYPPFQDYHIHHKFEKNDEIKVPKSPVYFSGPSLRRYNNEIQKNRDEIEEMRKHFILGQNDVNDFKNDYYRNNADQFQFFTQNNSRNNKPFTSAFQSYYRPRNYMEDDDYKVYSGYDNRKIEAQNESFQSISNVSAPKQNVTNFSTANINFNNDKFNSNNFNGNDFNDLPKEELDYNIISAETMEARLLRKQNEEIKKRIAFLNKKLDETKAENLKLLNKIEESEVQRHNLEMKFK